MISLSKLKSKFENIPQGSVILVVSDAEQILKININILKVLMKSQGSGLYITINQPYRSLSKIFTENKIDLKNLFFIDCITKTIHGEPERTKKCLFISSPRGLTELGIAVSEVLESIKSKNKFMFMDSLSTLLIYNSAGSIAKFSHFLMNKIRLSDVTGIFISIEKEMDKKLISQLCQFSDRTITIRG
jgi:KaiC/GvpD/RAD55 family RecA-like ATPase